MVGRHTAPIDDDEARERGRLMAEGTPRAFGLDAAPFDAWGLEHPMYVKAPKTLTDPAYFTARAAPGADDLPPPVDLLRAAWRHWSLPDPTAGQRCKVRVARQMRGKGLRGLASLLGSSAARLSKFENSHRGTLDRAGLSRLSTLLKVDPRWLTVADPQFVPDFLKPWSEYREAANRSVERYLRQSRLNDLVAEERRLQGALRTVRSQVISERKRLKRSEKAFLTARDSRGEERIASNRSSLGDD